VAASGRSTAVPTESTNATAPGVPTAVAAPVAVEMVYSVPVFAPAFTPSA
jgi:hypothetical protein